MLIEIPFNECFNAVIKCSFCINNSSLALSGYIFIWSLYPQVTFRKRSSSPYEPIKRVLISSGQLIIMSLVIQSLVLSCNIMGFHVFALASLSAFDFHYQSSFLFTSACYGSYHKATHLELRPSSRLFKVLNRILLFIAIERVHILIQSCYSHVEVSLCLNRIGLASISPSSLTIMSFQLWTFLWISLSIKT